MEYNIIAVQGPSRTDFTGDMKRLEKSVEVAIKAGWVPFGSVSVSIFAHGFVFAQAVVRMRNGKQ